MPGTSHPTLWDFAKVIIRVGLTSFGGGLSGWFLREFVTNKAWLTEEEFLSGLSLAQVFPGINVVNLSIWIGYRLHGGRGALAGALSITVPPMIVVILIAMVFAELSRYHVAHTLIDGVAAAAIGLALSMGLRAARRSGTNIGALLFMATAFVAIVFPAIADVACGAGAGPAQHRARVLAAVAAVADTPCEIAST